MIVLVAKVDFAGISLKTISKSVANPSRSDLIRGGILVQKAVLL